MWQEAIWKVLEPTLSHSTQQPAAQPTERPSLTEARRSSQDLPADVRDQAPSAAALLSRSQSLCSSGISCSPIIDELGTLRANAKQGRAIASLLAVNYVESSLDVDWMGRTHDAWLDLMQASFEDALCEDLGNKASSKLSSKEASSSSSSARLALARNADNL